MLAGLAVSFTKTRIADVAARDNWDDKLDSIGYETKVAPGVRE